MQASDSETETERVIIVNVSEVGPWLCSRVEPQLLLVQ